MNPADAASLTVAVIAKECVPGHVKTRLTPPYTPAQAAELAAAALDDTLAAVTALPIDRRVLYFSGERVPDAAAGFDVLAQVDGDLDVRLAHLFDEIDGPLLLIGMDTPQLGGEHVAAVIAAWAGRDERTAPDGSRIGGGRPGTSAAASVDAWIGLAADGGFWALAMREPRGDVIAGVPMSRSDTGAEQLRRLRDAGLRVAPLPIINDVDDAETAASVAAEVPASRFATALRRIDAERASDAPNLRLVPRHAGTTERSDR